MDDKYTEPKDLWKHIDLEQDPKDIIILKGLKIDLSRAIMALYQLDIATDKKIHDTIDTDLSKLSLLKEKYTDLLADALSQRYGNG